MCVVMAAGYVCGDGCWAFVWWWLLCMCVVVVAVYVCVGGCCVCVCWLLQVPVKLRCLQHLAVMQEKDDGVGRMCTGHPQAQLSAGQSSVSAQLATSHSKLTDMTKSMVDIGCTISGQFDSPDAMYNVLLILICYLLLSCGDVICSCRMQSLAKTFFSTIWQAV